MFHRLFVTLFISIVFICSGTTALAANPNDVEERSGELEVRTYDDFKNKKSEIKYFMRKNAKQDRIEIKFKGKPPAGLGTGKKVKIKGKKKGKIFEVEELESNGRSALNTGNAIVGGAAAATPPRIGVHNVIVFLVDLLDDKATDVHTVHEIEGFMYTATQNVNDLYKASSYNQFSFEGDANGDLVADIFPVAIDKYYVDTESGWACDYEVWSNEVETITANTINLGQYQHRVFIIPNAALQCDAGIADTNCVTGSTCRSWIGDAKPNVIGHELGHNLGFGHAMTDLDNDGVYVPSDGYGDKASLMGSNGNAYPLINAPHRDQVGWLDALPYENLQTINPGSQQFINITALEVDPGAGTAGTQIVKLLLDPLDHEKDIYVSYRKSIGDYGVYSSDADKITIHRSFVGNSALLARLGTTEEFFDPYSGSTVRFDSASSSEDYATVEVTVPALICGDGKVNQALEQCDDGNTDDGDNCKNDCTWKPSICGDGITEGVEVCDDSNTVGVDGCSADCLSDETCGNGIVDPGEECDGSVDCNMYLGQCIYLPADDIFDPVNGVVLESSSQTFTWLDDLRQRDKSWRLTIGSSPRGSEYHDITYGLHPETSEYYVTIDDGGSFDPARLSVVVSGLPIHGEPLYVRLYKYDTGNVYNDYNYTAVNLNVCGDSSMFGAEECDDGNTLSGDGCDATCLIEPEYYCGNGIYERGYGETCDDGNTNNGDGCSSACQREGCGDGVVNNAPNETCDDGVNNGTPGFCTSTCDGTVPTVCGDNIQSVGETCDDGNTVNGDGCDASCQLESICGNGIYEYQLGEQCDDGNTMNGDGCTSTCVREGCGDGIINNERDGNLETCDDGNIVPGDGCDGSCQLESSCGNGIYERGYGEQCDDGNTMSGDGCSSTCMRERG